MTKINLHEHLPLFKIGDKVKINITKETDGTPVGIVEDMIELNGDSFTVCEQDEYSFSKNKKEIIIYYLTDPNEYVWLARFFEMKPEFKKRIKEFNSIISEYPLYKFLFDYYINWDDILQNVFPISKIKKINCDLYFISGNYGNEYVSLFDFLNKNNSSLAEKYANFLQKGKHQ